MMERPYIEDKAFERMNFSETALVKGDYECCTFSSCDLSNADLSDFRFIDCSFTACNLSNAVLTKASFQEADFKECKMLGLPFDTCNPLGLTLSFENCQLNHASFFRVKLGRIRFINCALQEVDFTEANLNGAHFDQCDLLNSIFENTLLEKADFTTAFNYTFDPENNYLRGAKFSMPSVTGLLNKYDIDIQ